MFDICTRQRGQSIFSKWKTRSEKLEVTQSQISTLNNTRRRKTFDQHKTPHKKWEHTHVKKEQLIKSGQVDNS